MKKLLIKILRSLPGIVAVLGLILVVGAAGACDCGAPVREWLPLALVGFVLAVGAAVPGFIKSMK